MEYLDKLTTVVRDQDPEQTCTKCSGITDGNGAKKRILQYTERRCQRRFCILLRDHMASRLEVMSILERRRCGWIGAL